MVSYARRTDWVVIGILAIGVMLRLALFIFNPPNNAYDDHLETIAYYLNHHERPAPGTCWECYQPPLYYALAAGLYQLSFWWSKSYFMAWKAVQGINTLLSIATLSITCHLVKQVFAGQRQVILLLVALAAVLPRDLYAASMITNDYQLVFLTALSVWLFLTYSARHELRFLVGLCLSAAACALTKQHGLIVLLLPAVILVRSLWKMPSPTARSFFTPSVIVPLLGIGIGLSDEIWKFSVTHVLLVSNQHYFDYARNQPPGSVSNIEFYSLRLIALFQHPLLSQSTWASYWTALFASTWFDYEYRFVTPQLPGIKALAALLYTYGLGIGGMAAVGTVKWLALSRANRWRPNWVVVSLVFVALCFFLVPLVQTLRLPHYSSMKSQFFLPGSTIIMLGFGYVLREIRLLRTPIAHYALVSSTLIIGVAHVAYIIEHLPQALGALSGPLWQFPNLLL